VLLPIKSREEEGEGKKTARNEDKMMERAFTRKLFVYIYIYIYIYIYTKYIYIYIYIYPFPWLQGIEKGGNRETKHLKHK
jgi:hypothetical protein